MGVFYETIPQSIRPWILEQKMFWVATAPLSGSGHVNVSPKGGEYFGVIDEKTFWYLELTGSGCETLAHLHEKGNGRITIMLSAFSGPPRIIRLWGKGMTCKHSSKVNCAIENCVLGRVLESESPEFDAFVSKHQVKVIPGTRSIIIVDIHQVGSSCGFSVPFYDFKAHRDTLNEYFRKKDLRFKDGNEKESMDIYWAQNSQFSMDGLPGMKRGVEVGKREKIPQKKKMVGPLVPKNRDTGSGGLAAETAMLVFVSFLLGVLATLYAGSFRSFATGLRDVVVTGNINASAEWYESLPLGRLYAGQ